MSFFLICLQQLGLLLRRTLRRGLCVLVCMAREGGDEISASERLILSRVSRRNPAVCRATTSACSHVRVLVGYFVVCIVACWRVAVSGVKKTTSGHSLQASHRCRIIAIVGVG
ncbi:unnamed protein product [Ectocarpus sp. 12 AP-2014]